MIETFWIGVLSIWAHELGHALASKLTRDRLGSRRWSWKPLVNLDPILTFVPLLVTSLLSGGSFAAGAGRPFLLERADWRVLVAGPVVNVVLAILFAVLGMTQAATVNVALAAFNLLPLRPLDGWAIYTVIRERRLMAWRKRSQEGQ